MFVCECLLTLLYVREGSIYVYTPSENWRANRHCYLRETNANFFFFRFFEKEQSTDAVTLQGLFFIFY